MPAHQDIEKEVEEAAERAKRAERDYLSSRRRYQKLQKQVKGPFTIDMIAAEAHYRRACMERTNAKYKLRGLLAIQKSRKKRK
jgi:hypothetical protein